jgi:myo-inositol-1(or 4)-monophosphatase
VRDDNGDVVITGDDVITGDEPSPDALLALAESVARDAGALVRSRRPPDAPDAGISVTATKTSPTDVVTAMDSASEELIRSRLLAARPYDGFLGEEAAATAGRSSVTWVVDPIDGTVNYVYDIPQYAVSIAAEVDGRVVAGVVHNPVSGETWTATLGGGARLDGRPIEVSRATRLEAALVGTGFGYRAERRRVQARLAAELLPVVRDIRRMGAASLDLCAVATGRLDAYYEQGLAPWDLAAGGLVATEAGAVVAGANGAAAGPDLVIAAPPALFDALHAQVARLATE